MQLFKCYHEQHEFFGGKIPAVYFSKDPKKIKTLDCLKKFQTVNKERITYPNYGQDPHAYMQKWFPLC